MSDWLSGKTVSLVLGSGGARGLAHIGVIRALEAAGARIEAVSGSSMGALVGGIYATGKLQAYEDWVCGLERSDVLSFVDWSFAGGGLMQGRKIINKLEELVGKTNIEELEIDFTAVAVDIDHGREVWLSRGSLFDAIRASIAIPGIFTPHRYRGRTFVDGGILNPVPVAPTLRNMTDLTIVVDVNGPESDPAPLEEGPPSDNESEGVMNRLREFVDGFRSDRQPEETRPGLLAVLMRSLDTMQSVIARQHLAVFQPDLAVLIPKNACMVHEFYQARAMIDLGRDLAEQSFRSRDRYTVQPAPYDKAENETDGE
ncbi:patatin-like phospholipase family protein [Wenzhouxiangella sp. AB-CW3]|uniref:patatin-like phospholipase family protein n=1 Tax=Wenzhouxiangella sp. AB-CW3 TaxID=2771012 RepID=UPI00168A6359|nr:patatin-like phospholipase family protein [Wenzhouxiangella sp. AB-CW3]QOC21772.1 patatin-like phospholipase family protein [Wenzhouxiangella sp. AB-CW3]